METVMETVLNKIFTTCDTNDSGTTSVSKIIDCITPFMQSNLADLRELRRLLNSNDSGDEIVTKNGFEQAMKAWVAMYQDPQETCVEIANTRTAITCQIEISSFLETAYSILSEKFLQKSVPFEQDKTFLEDRIKELEHFNRKLTDELMQHKIQEQVCEETIENLKMSLENVNQKLANSKHKIDLFENDLVELEELREKQLKFVQKTDKLEKLTITMEKEMQTLRQKNENLKNQKKSLLDKANLNDKKENDLEMSFNYLQDQLLEKSDMVDLLSSDNEILKMNNSEQKKYAGELQNIIDALKYERPQNKNDSFIDQRADRNPNTTLVQESILKSSGRLSQNLNLQAEFEEYDCVFDKTTLQGQLDAIEHRCCKESKKRLSNQIDILNLKLGEQRDCIKNYIEQLKDYEQTIKDNSLKELNLSELIDDLKTKLTKQEKLTIEKDLEINKLNLDLTELDSYASKVKSEFENNFLTIKDLENNLKHIQISNSSFTEQNKKLQQDLEFITQSKLHLEQENKNLKLSESECDLVKEEFDHLENIQKELENKLSESQKDNKKLQDIIKTLNESNQILEKRNNEIIDSNKIILKDSDELNKTLDLKIKEMQTHHERKLEELSTALDSKMLDFDRVSHELSLSQRNCTGIKDEKNQLMLQINLLDVRIKEVNKWNHSLKLEKEHLNDELIVSSKKLKNREEQHTNLKIKYNELSKQKGDCGKTIDDYERKVRCLENETRKLQGVNEDSCSKILDFEEKLAVAKERELALGEIKADLSSRLNQTKDNLGKLEITLKDLLQNEEILQTSCDHLKVENHNLHTQNIKLHNDLSKLNAVSTTYCENCSKLEEKLNDYLKSNRNNNLQTNPSADLRLSRKDSYGKLSLRLEKVQNKLELKESELNQSQIMILDLKEKLSNVDPSFNTPRSASSSDDLEFLIRQLTVDRLILQSALNAFVTKWRTALKKIPKADEIINFVDNETESINKQFPNNFKELHMLTKYISLIVLAFTIINELQPNPLNNLNIKTKTASKPPSYIFLNSEQGKGSNSEVEPDDDLFYNTTQVSPSLTDAVLESLQLSGDTRGTANISDTDTNPSRLEYRICQLMVSFRLDNETVSDRYSAQAQIRDRMDGRLLDAMRSMMDMIVCAGGEGRDGGTEGGVVLRTMQRKLQQINVLCCRTVQSAEQLGALHHEHKIHKALHLITNYVARLEKIIYETNQNCKTNTMNIGTIKARKSLTNLEHPKYTILRSFENSTQTNEKQSDRIFSSCASEDGSTASKMRI